MKKLLQGRGSGRLQAASRSSGAAAGALDPAGSTFTPSGDTVADFTRLRLQDVHFSYALDRDVAVLRGDSANTHAHGREFLGERLELLHLDSSVLRATAADDSGNHNVDASTCVLARTFDRPCRCLKRTNLLKLCFSLGYRYFRLS